MEILDLHNNQEIQILLKSGDESVFDAVYTFYFSRLCAFGSQYIELSECEEIVQEVMLWLWENRQALVPELSLKSLLFTMVKNKCLNRLEHTIVKQKVHEKLIEKLPKEYRKAFEMNRFENMTYNEIAEISGVSSKTIAYRISQALKILRTELKDYIPLLTGILFT